MFLLYLVSKGNISELKSRLNTAEERLDRQIKLINEMHKFIGEQNKSLCDLHNMVMQDKNERNA